MIFVIGIDDVLLICGASSKNKLPMNTPSRASASPYVSMQGGGHNADERRLVELGLGCGAGSLAAERREKKGLGFDERKGEKVGVSGSMVLCHNKFQASYIITSIGTFSLLVSRFSFSKPITLIVFIFLQDNFFSCFFADELLFWFKLNIECV